jgi:hypothetical protein
LSRGARLTERLGEAWVEGQAIRQNGGQRNLFDGGIGGNHYDTSSVVGASLPYGARALEIAATIMLTRALWIVPVTRGIGMVWNRGSIGPLAKPNGRGS